jgi:hypothetical protein
MIGTLKTFETAGTFFIGSILFSLGGRKGRSGRNYAILILHQGHETIASPGETTYLFQIPLVGAIVPCHLIYLPLAQIATRIAGIDTLDFGSGRERGRRGAGWHIINPFL